MTPGKDGSESREGDRSAFKERVEVNPITQLNRYCHLNCGSVFVRGDSLRRKRRRRERSNLNQSRED